MEESVQKLESLAKKKITYSIFWYVKFETPRIYPNWAVLQIHKYVVKILITEIIRAGLWSVIWLKWKAHIMERMHTGIAQTSYTNPLSYWVLNSPILYYKSKAFYLNIFSTHWSYEVIFSRISKVIVAQSCPTLCDPMNCNLPGSSVLDSPGKNTRVHSHSLFQGIFPTQGLNWVSCVAGRFFIVWATREAFIVNYGF